jgi:hypothetical protein
MDRNIAEDLAALFKRASTFCHHSLDTVKANETFGQAERYSRLVGQFTTYCFTNVLAPIWRKFPELEPAELKELEGVGDLSLTPESEEALRAFLAEFRRAIFFAKETIAAGKCADLFCSEEIAEVEEAASRIEVFLARPSPREPDRT